MTAHLPDTSDNHAESPAAPRTGFLRRVRRALGGTEPSHDEGGASWSKVHIADGDADFALAPAPGVAGTGRRQGAPDRAEEAEGSLHHGQGQPAHADDSDPLLPPTVTADAFVHRGVAALDIPALPDDTASSSSSRRPLSEILYRPRSGTNRTVQLTCSAEPAERDFIDHAARAAKRSRSAYLMDAGLTFAHAYVSDQRPDGVPPLPSPQATQDLTLLCGTLLREFHRIGVNLNQIARAVNMGTLPDHADQVLDDLHALARAARRALEHVISGCRHGA